MREYFVLQPEGLGNHLHLGAEYEYWSEKLPEKWRGFSNLTIRDKATAKSYYDRATAVDSDVWGEWTNESGSIEIPAETTDAKVLSGYDALRALGDSYDERKIRKLGKLQIVGAQLHAVDRYHKSQEYGRLVSDPAIVTGFYFVGHGDNGISQFRVREDLVDPLGNKHPFVPVSPTRLKFTHTSHSYILANILGYMQRVGVPEDTQAEMVSEFAAPEWDGDTETDTAGEVRIAHGEGRGGRNFENQLSWPLSCDPGSSHGTALYVRGEELVMELFDFENRASRTDKNMSFTREDMPLLVRLVCQNALGESITNIEALLAQRFPTHFNTKSDQSD